METIEITATTDFSFKGVSPKNCGPEWIVLTNISLKGSVYAYKRRYVLTACKEYAGLPRQVVYQWGN